MIEAVKAVGLRVNGGKDITVSAGASRASTVCLDKSLSY